MRTQVRDSHGLYAVCDKAGLPYMDTLSPLPENAIKYWMYGWNRSNRPPGHFPPSFEAYEAEGYSVHRFKLLHDPNELFP